MTPTLDAPLDSLTVLEKRLVTALAKGGFTRVSDLLFHYPFRYEDRTAFDGWPNGSEAPGSTVCLEATVTDVQSKRVGPGRAYVAVKVAPSAAKAPADESPALEGLRGLATPLTLRWFNMPFIARSFAADQTLIIYGKPKPAKGGALVMDHPEFEILDDTPKEEAAIHLQRIAPIYGAREGVPQKSLRRAVWQVLDAMEDEAMPDMLPEPSGRGEFAGQWRAQALRFIHFPPTLEAKNRARRYLALEEFFILQREVLQRRQQWADLQGTSQCGPGGLMNHWLEALPFPLTAAQSRCIAEIRSDLSRPSPMNRLLQGDVGSGKTFVAMAAMLLTVESGAQAALMAPTQILAEQHYLNFRRWLEPLGLRIGLRTAARKEDGFDPLFHAGEERPQILLGTHSLLYGDAELPDLGLAVIDEQHKFGVEQRARLVRQGIAPHVLVMTATPIPRTLTMTVYGDLDISVLDELPQGRQPVITAVREDPDIDQVASFLKQQFEAGRQAYLVYPLIDESDSLKVKAATREHAIWTKKLEPFPVGLLHGRLKPEEKEAVMNDFRSNRIQALVATSVIEVGVDVPNASVMIIFEAGRFGLAQLHQLRGRIGRGAHKSYCILATSSGGNAEGLERLNVLAGTSDGFVVAEADLRSRGPGDLLGSAQSGVGKLVLGDLVNDESLVRLARRLAAKSLAIQPPLETGGPASPPI